jgi:hypothetical protein
VVPAVAAEGRPAAAELELDERSQLIANEEEEIV